MVGLVARRVAIGVSRLAILPPDRGPFASLKSLLDVLSSTAANPSWVRGRCRGAWGFDESLFQSKSPASSPPLGSRSNLTSRPPMTHSDT